MNSVIINSLEKACHDLKNNDTINNFHIDIDDENNTINLKIEPKKTVQFIENTITIQKSGVKFDEK